MNDKRRLDEWIDKLEGGDLSLDELLEEATEAGEEEQVLLKTAARVKGIRKLKPSSSYKESARQELTEFMRDHPRGQEQAGQRTAFFPRLVRFAAAAAPVLLAVLVTGTALAQSARPGDRLYPWKRSSERAYRALHPDPTAAEMQIARRRFKEVLAADNPWEREVSLDGYHHVLGQLLAGLQPGEKDTVLNALELQQEELQSANLEVPLLNQIIKDLSEGREEDPVPTVLPEGEEEIVPGFEPTEDPLLEDTGLDLPTITVEPDIEELETDEILPEN